MIVETTKDKTDVLLILPSIIEFRFVS